MKRNPIDDRPAFDRLRQQRRPDGWSRMRHNGARSDPRTMFSNPVQQQRPAAMFSNSNYLIGNNPVGQSAFANDRVQYGSGDNL
jgi:hypothetical protein